MTVLSVLQNALTEVDSKIVATDVNFDSIQRLIEIRASLQQALGVSSSGTGGTTGGTGDGPLTVARLDTTLVRLASLLTYVNDLVNYSVSINSGTSVLPNIEAVISSLNSITTDILPKLDTWLEKILLDTNAIDVAVDSIANNTASIDSNLLLVSGYVTSIAANTNDQIDLLNNLRTLTSISNTELNFIRTSSAGSENKLNTLTTLDTARNTKLDTINTKLDSLISVISVLTNAAFTIPTNGLAVLCVPAQSTRKYLIIQNTSAVNIYIGFSNAVTAVNGLTIPPLGSMSFVAGELYTGDIWAFKTTGTGTLTLVQG
jgi:hypothetical protein